MMENIFKKIGSIMRGQLYFETGKSYKETVLLCGSGRSGTTWLAEILNNDNTFRYMFEPFHPDHVKIVKHFSSRQYIQNINKSKEFLVPASMIFSGRIRNLWIDRYNKNIWPNRRLIKDIRINLFLRWIKINFPYIPIVFMLRHPFSVACSRIRLGWKDHLNSFYKQKHLANDFLIINNDLYSYIETDFERQILMWCIENYVPLKTLKKDEMYIIFYEKLLTNPVKEITRLFDFLNLSVSDYLFNKIKNPSQMTKNNSPLMTGENPLTYWEKIISFEQRRNALKILEKFGLDEIYDDEALPNISGLENI